MATNAHADAWYTTGDTHVVGEDYAVAVDLPSGDALAVVCDGCSASADTDVGARLLARAALATTVHGCGPADSLASVRRAAQAAAVLGLPVAALDATLLVAHAGPETIDVSVTGDGVVAARRRDGTVEIWVVSHPDGAPPYASYALDAERRRAYRQRYRALSDVAHRNHDGDWETRASELDTHRWALPTADYELILLGTDGLQSFVGPDPDTDSPGDGSTLGSAVEVDAIVDALMRVPQRSGRFVARRGRRFVNRTCPARGWRALDDVGIAAVALPEVPR